MKNFLGLEKENSEYNGSKYVIVPLPLEFSTSYGKGAQAGPQAIIDASQYVELYDSVLGFEPYHSGICTLEPLKYKMDPQKDFPLIIDYYKKLIFDGKIVIGLGGEHSVTYPAFKAYNESFENLSIIQFDAHSDLREEYEGSIYSHASVMKRIYDLNKNIVQVGIRSQCIEEAQLIKDNRINTFYAHTLKKEGFNKNILDGLSENVYITIDVDFFDPSIMPSTGTPEPGGFFWDETVAFFELLTRCKNVVGFDVVELAPQKELPHPDFMTAKLIYHIIGLIEKNTAIHC